MQFIVIQLNEKGQLMAHYAPAKHDAQVKETSCELTSVEQFTFINAIARINNAIVTVHSTVQQPAGWTRNRKVIQLCKAIFQSQTVEAGQR